MENAPKPSGHEQETPTISEVRRDLLCDMSSYMCALDAADPDFPEDSSSRQSATLREVGEGGPYELTRNKMLRLPDGGTIITDSWTVFFDENDQIIDFILRVDSMYDLSFLPQVTEERKKLLTETDAAGNGNELLNTLLWLKTYRQPEGA